MRVDKKILEEIARYNSINKYINEQELPPPPVDPAAEGGLPPPPGDPAGGALPPPPGDPAAAGALPPPDPTMAGGEPQPVDVSTDPDVEKLGDEDENKKDVEITDLVKSQKNIETKQDDYFDNLFKQLSSLEDKLSEMDGIVDKLNSLESKIEKYRAKTPEEKLQLRSLDSGPFNQKLSDYFFDNQDKFEKTGKDEYILTKDDVEDFSGSDVRKSFRDFGNDDDFVKIN